MKQLLILISVVLAVSAYNLEDVASGRIEVKSGYLLRGFFTCLLRPQNVYLYRAHIIYRHAGVVRWTGCPRWSNSWCRTPRATRASPSISSAARPRSWCCSTPATMSSTDSRSRPSPAGSAMNYLKARASMLKQTCNSSKCIYNLWIYHCNRHSCLVL